MRLAVYDARGRKVAVLVDQPQAAGRHRTTFDAAGLSSGTYFYRLQAGDHHATGRMVLVR